MACVHAVESASDALTCDWYSWARRPIAKAARARYDPWFAQAWEAEAAALVRAKFAPVEAFLVELGSGGGAASVGKTLGRHDESTFG